MTLLRNAVNMDMQIHAFPSFLDVFVRWTLLITVIPIACMCKLTLSASFWKILISHTSEWYEVFKDDSLFLMLSWISFKWNPSSQHSTFRWKQDVFYLFVDLWHCYFSKWNEKISCRILDFGCIVKSLNWVNHNYPNTGEPDKFWSLKPWRTGVLWLGWS